MEKSSAASPPIQWTLGERVNGYPMWCVYCGRNSVADGVPVYVMRESGKLPSFACVCCYEFTCKHTDPVVAICGRCRRPVIAFNGFGGGRVHLVGSVTPEGDFKSRLRAGGTVNGKEIPNKDPLWSSRIWDVSADGTPWDEREGAGGDRYKAVCVGRKHQQEWVIKRADLLKAFVMARQNGTTRILVSDIAKVR